MRIAILGPIDIRERDTSIVPTARKQRQVLALLAASCNNIVTTATLIDELWGEDVPRTATTTVQTYIAQIRHRIADATPGSAVAAKRRLVTEFNGYRLIADPAWSDVERFRQLSAAGAASYERGDHVTAVRQLSSAVDLWRGPALVDVRLGRVLSIEVMGMEEERRHIQGLYFDANLRVGRQDEILPMLRTLVSENPMDEGFCSQFMLALYRSGYAWRAMEAFSAIRRVLVDELGVEPSLRLRQLHHKILAGDANLMSTEWGPNWQAV